MGDPVRLLIESVQGARKQAYPHDVVRRLIDRLNPAGQETIVVAGAMPMIPKLFLPEIENIQPCVLSSHPEQAASILIDRHDRVTVEAIRIAFIVLKAESETLCATVKVVNSDT